MGVRILEHEIEELKTENAYLQRTIDSLKESLEDSKESYSKLSEEKRHLESKIQDIDAGLGLSLYLGAPIGGLVFVLFELLCDWLGLFQDFFQRFEENSSLIAMFACGALISYALFRLYYKSK